jgi:anti-anti-sigma factor
MPTHHDVLTVHDHVPTVEEPPALEIDTASQADAYVIRLRGELDLAGCAQLEAILSEAEAGEANRIVLDLEELGFLDVTGVGAIYRASRRSSMNGNRLQITRGSGAVARIFGLFELDALLPLTDPALCPAIQNPR